MAAGDAGAKYALGSVLNHVLLHQVRVAAAGVVRWVGVGQVSTCRLAVRCSGSQGCTQGAAALRAAAAATSRSRPPSCLPTHLPIHAPQTVIGEEALEQLAMVGETPDLIVGCTGGGSNFGGLCFPFMREKLAGKMAPIIRAVEPEACPSLTMGKYEYDFGEGRAATG